MVLSSHSRRGVQKKDVKCESPQAIARDRGLVWSENVIFRDLQTKQVDPDLFRGDPDLEK